MPNITMEICVTYITIITFNYNPSVKFLFVFHWNNSVSKPLIKGLHLFRYRKIVQTTELQDDLDPFFFVDKKYGLLFYGAIVSVCRPSAFRSDDSAFV